MRKWSAAIRQSPQPGEPSARSSTPEQDGRIGHRYLRGSTRQFYQWLVGKAHGRQMDRQTSTDWQTELRKQHSKSLDAPGWLWNSVVSLIAEHEVAYLEHCRRYAAAI